jgi:tripartite-type tricarboxylate transporter receptor subunit TctC
MKMSVGPAGAVAPVAAFLGVTALSLLTPIAANAQKPAYPVKTVRIIVPSPPGGVSDIAARLMGEALSKKWHQQVLVENRPGGGGSIGLQAAVSAPPDGYTLYATTNSQTTIDPVVAPATGEVASSFIPLVLTSDNPILLVANANFPYDDLPSLIAAAKKAPGKFAYGTAGVASVPHLAAEWVASAAGVKFRHIPFKGGAPAVAAVASGEVPLASIAYSSAQPFVRSGKVKAIALTTRDRIAAAPDWPTAAEAGYSDVDISVWTGLFAVKGTPRAIVAQIEQDVGDLLKDPQLKERFESVGARPGGLAGQAFADLIARETKNIERVVREAAIKIE